MGMTNALNLLCGLALFLYGMHVMGEGLTRASGGRLEGILESLTKSKIKAVLLGAGVTAGIEVAGRAEALLPNPTAVEMIVECAKRLPDVVITEDRTRGSDDSTLWMNAVTKDGGVAGCFHYGSRGRAGLHTSSFDPEGEFTAIPALRLSVELLLSTNRRGDA